MNLEAPVTVRNQLNHDRTVTERRVGEKVKYPFEINFDGIAPERKRKHTNVSAPKNAGMFLDNSDAQSSMVVDQRSKRKSKSVIRT